MRIFPELQSLIYSSKAFYAYSNEYTFLTLLVKMALKLSLTVSLIFTFSSDFNLAHQNINTNPEIDFQPHLTYNPLTPEISYPLILPYTYKLLNQGMLLKICPVKGPPTQSTQAFTLSFSQLSFKSFSKFASKISKVSAPGYFL